MAGCDDAPPTSNDSPRPLDLEGQTLYDLDTLTLPNRTKGADRVPVQAVHYWQFEKNRISFTTELTPNQEAALRQTRIPFGISVMYQVYGEAWGVEAVNDFEGRLFMNALGGKRVVFERSESDALLSRIEPLEPAIFSLDYLAVGDLIKLGDGKYRSISPDSLAALLK